MMSKAVAKSLLPRFHRLFLWLGVLLIMLAAFLYIYMFRGMTMSSDILFIQSSKLVNGGLLLNGSTSSSANGYSGYSFELQDEKLILKVRYIPLANHWHPSGEFRIQFSENDLKGIRQVYLYSKGRDDQLIWKEV